MYMPHCKYYTLTIPVIFWWVAASLLGNLKRWFNFEQLSGRTIPVTCWEILRKNFGEFDPSGEISSILKFPLRIINPKNPRVSQPKSNHRYLVEHFPSDFFFYKKHRLTAFFLLKKTSRYHHFCFGLQLSLKTQTVPQMETHRISIPGAAQMFRSHTSAERWRRRPRMGGVGFRGGKGVHLQFFQNNCGNFVGWWERVMSPPFFRI